MNGTIPVDVTPVALTKEIYNELLTALDTEEEEYGRTAEGVNARRWLHYQWLLAQSNAHEPPAP